MLRYFLQSQEDYLLFICGLAFVFLGMTAWSFRRLDSSRLPWGWFAFFGVVHGASYWAKMLVQGLGLNVSEVVLQLAFAAVAFTALLEFSRHGMSVLRSAVPESWLPPLLLPALVGVLAGVPGVLATVRYFLGLTGCWWSAWMLWRYRQAEARDSRALAVVAVALALYAVPAALVGARASFFPASHIHEASFRMAFGFPIEAVRAALGVILSAGLLGYFIRDVQRRRTPEGAPARGKQRGAAVALLVLVALGWAAVQTAGWRRQAGREAWLKQAAARAAAGLDATRARELSGQPSDREKPEFDFLARQLRTLAPAGHNLRRLCMLVERDGRIFIALDSTPENLADFAEPGTECVETPLAIRKAFASGQPVVTPPYSDRWGRFVSALIPMRDPVTGRVMAFLGADMDAFALGRQVAGVRLAVIGGFLVAALVLVRFVTWSF